MTQKTTAEERQALEHAQILEEASRLFGLTNPKRPESDRWLYDQLVRSAKYWIELEDERHYELLASCVLHSGRVRENQTTPYLFCHGPTGTGKNRIGHWLKVLCQRGLLVEQPSVASLFWTMERHEPTLIIDEAEKLAPYRKNQGELAEALIEILNAGYQQDQYVPRVQKDAGTLKFYDPYGFKVILSTETLPDTTLGRSVVINTDENVSQDIPVSHPTRDDPGIKELRQYLEYYWGQFEPGSTWHKDPEPTLTFDDLKRMIPNYRAVEKFGPLYRVSPDPRAQAHILELAKEDSDDRREERGVGMDAEILRALAAARADEIMALTPGDPLTDRYGVADITKRFNEGREKWETLSNDQVGRKLRKFGLKPCRSHGGLRCVLWNETRMQRRFKRYGIPPPPAPILVSSVTREGNDYSSSRQAAERKQPSGDTRTLWDTKGRKAGPLPGDSRDDPGPSIDETMAERDE
jgi:hypothetical protein